MLLVSEDSSRGAREGACAGGGIAACDACDDCDGGRLPVEEGGRPFAPSGCACLVGNGGVMLSMRSGSLRVGGADEGGVGEGLLLCGARATVFGVLLRSVELARWGTRDFADDPGRSPLLDSSREVEVFARGSSRCISSVMSLRVWGSSAGRSLLLRASQCRLNTINEERAAARTSPTASARPFLIAVSIWSTYVWKSKKRGGRERIQRRVDGEGE